MERYAVLPALAGGPVSSTELRVRPFKERVRLAKGTRVKTLPKS